MKKIPLTLLPLLILGIFAYLFKYVVPVNESLISDPVDTILGVIVGGALVICLILDFIRFSKK